MNLANHAEKVFKFAFLLKDFHGKTPMFPELICVSYINFNEFM